MKASLRYKDGSLVGETNSVSIAPITSDAIETGPTPKCLELPRTEYIIGGTKLESVKLLCLN